MIPLRNITIGQLLTEKAKEYGSNIAIEYEKVTWSYKALDVFSDSLAKGFMAKGISRGTHVGIWAPVDPNVLLVFFALQKIGAVTVMFYTNIHPKQLKEQLSLTNCKYLLVCSEQAKMEAGNLCADLEEKKLCGIMTIGNGRFQSFINFSDILGKARLVSGTRLEKAKSAVKPKDPAVILFTASTAGGTNAVVASHYSIVNSGIQQAADLNAASEDSFCMALPLFHCFGLSANIMVAIAAGAKVYLLGERRTHKILEVISQRKCTILNGVPTMFHTICRREDLQNYDLSSLRTGIIGGGVYSPSQLCEYERKLGLKLLPSFGLTEAMGGITVCNQEDSLEIRSETVGHFMAHIEGKIVDPVTGLTLPDGKTGEICVRGYAVMEEYYGNPELTKDTVDPEGWLHTGNLGWLDEADNVHMCGRIRDLIIRGGENISPVEVQNTIRGFEKVKGVKVIGVPDEHYGEELCACVIPGETGVTEDEIRAFAARHLVKYKIPKYILLVTELPQYEGSEALQYVMKRIQKSKDGISC